MLEKLATSHFSVDFRVSGEVMSLSNDTMTKQLILPDGNPIKKTLKFQMNTEDFHGRKIKAYKSFS